MRFDVQNWIYLAGAVLLVIPLVWVALRARRVTLDIEPVSQHWLAERKRITEAE